MKKMKVVSHKSVMAINNSLVALLLIVFCLTQLSGCGVVSRQFASHDGPPAVDIDVSKIKDAVPREEPIHPYGTRDYVIRGHHYHVLKSYKGYVKNGYASWYGSDWHGKETATQERYNMYAMTAASPELPIPCYAQVTNLLNGKKVVVRINDRGPHYGKRILDLSYAAAKKLDFVNRGVVPVKIVAIDPKTWGRVAPQSHEIHYAEAEHRHNNYAVAKPRRETLSDVKVSTLTSTTNNIKQIFLQVGAFAKLDNAQRLSDKINQIVDKPVRIEHKADLYRVHIGPLASSSQCSEIKSLLEQKGFDNITVIGG